jgi:hypothetical protein
MAGQTTNYLFDYPTSTDYVKDGATAIQTLATDVDTTLFTALGGAYPGLRLVKKQVVGSGVSSVTVTDAFSATYENYKIIYNGGTSSAQTTTLMRLGASTSTYYGGFAYVNWSTGAVAGAGTNNGSSWNFAGGLDINAVALNVDIQSPFLAKYTMMNANAVNYGTNKGTYVASHETATSYTSFSLTPNTGTMTGGTIWVYGYGAS